MELLGKKVGMTQLFDAKGNMVGCTVVEAGPCAVLQKKTPETDGYHAVQLGFGAKKQKNATKPMIGHCKKANVVPAPFIREYRSSEPVQFNVGDKITVKFIPARDGSPLGFLKTVVMPDGRVIQISAGNAND